MNISTVIFKEKISRTGPQLSQDPPSQEDPGLVPMLRPRKKVHPKWNEETKTNVCECTERTNLIQPIHKQINKVEYITYQRKRAHELNVRRRVDACGGGATQCSEVFAAFPVIVADGALDGDSPQVVGRPAHGLTEVPFLSGDGQSQGQIPDASG